MIIGIMSDSHDNKANLLKALEIFRQKKAEAIIHCGDFCAPFNILDLDEAGIPVHAVFGNTDDRYGTTITAAESKNVKVYGDTAEVELGKKIFFTHFPHIASAFAMTGKYDYVFHGHTHKQRDELMGSTRIINPGEVLGRKGTPSVALLDTENDKLEFIDIQ